MSHPSRVRGLKYPHTSRRVIKVAVAPLAGAWIEITLVKICDYFNVVAPLAGAWIEMSRSRGGVSNGFVAPLAGAWIEM